MYKNSICCKKTKFFKLLFGLVFLVFISENAFGQFSIEGIEGLSFSKDEAGYEIQIANSFLLHGMKIQPKNLMLKWNPASVEFSFSGNAVLTVEETEMQITLGSAEKPGLLIRYDSIVEVDLTVTTEFSIKSLKIKPTGLTFIYDEKENDYNISGDIELDIEGDTIKAILGDLTDPGIEIKDGKIDKIDIEISGDFKLKDLEIETDSLGFSWQKGISGFHMFGKVNLNIENDKISFSFGNFENPGLIFEDGSVTSFKIGTTDDLHFGGLEVETENFTLEHHNDTFHISGKLQIKELWKAEIDLGTGPHSGVTLTTKNGNDTFEIEQAKFEFDDIKLGSMTVEKLMLFFEDNKMKEDSIRIKFQPGWVVDGDLVFNAGVLDSISIDWEALEIEDALEIPGTGSVITKIKGAVNHIHEPEKFILYGDIGIAFGGPFTIDGTEVSLVYLETKATIDRDELTIESDADVGAYKDDDGWHAILGDGTLKLDFKWANSYSLSGDFNVPAGENAIISADLNAVISDSGAFNASAKVSLQVPISVPLIGGLQFAEADGVVHYDKTDPASYAAGWAKLNLGFYSLNGGVKYNFSTKDFSTLGSKEIKDIEAVSGSPLPLPPYVQYININVDGENPNFLQIKIHLKETVSDIIVAVIQPSAVGQVNYAPLYFGTGEIVKNNSGMDISTLPVLTANQLYNTDSLVFFIMAPGYQTESRAVLPSGVYTVEILDIQEQNVVKNYEVHKIFEAPTISGFAYSSKLEYHHDQPIPWVWNYQSDFYFSCNVFNTDSATVSFFVTKNRAENGSLLATGPLNDFSFYEDGTRADVYLTESLLPNIIDADDSVFFYVKLDDGINATVKSEVIPTENFINIGGKIQIAGQPDSLASGIEVSLWGWFEWYNHPAGYYKINLDKELTNSDGGFGFAYDISMPTQLKVEVDIPYGYEVDPASHFWPDSPFNWEKGDTWKNIDLLLRKIN